MRWRAAHGRRLAQWSRRFARVLALFELTAGAARQRSSHTQQVLQRLDELLQECAALPAALGRFTAAEALAVFAQLLARTRFEPASGDAAVTLTASFADPILRYDGIWVSGLHAGAIPQPARFDPFIPAALAAPGRNHRPPMRPRWWARRSRRWRRCVAAAANSSSALRAHAEDLELAALTIAGALCAAAPRTRAARRRLRSGRGPSARARRIERYEDEPGLPWAEAGRCRPAPGRSNCRAAVRSVPTRNCASAQTRWNPRARHHAARARPHAASGAGIAVAAPGRLRGARRARAPTASLNGSIRTGCSPGGRRNPARCGPGWRADEAFAPAADATGLLELRRAAIARELRAGAAADSHRCVSSRRRARPSSSRNSRRRIGCRSAARSSTCASIGSTGWRMAPTPSWTTNRAVPSAPDWEWSAPRIRNCWCICWRPGVPVSALAVVTSGSEGRGVQGHWRSGRASAGREGRRRTGRRSGQAGSEQVAQLAADFVHGACPRGSHGRGL